MTTTPQLRLTQPIDADPAAVWAVLTDIGAAASTLSGVDAVEVLTEGPYAVGTTWRETRSVLGMRATEEMEVIEADEPRSTVVVARSGDVLYRTQFRLEPTERGTDLTMTFGAAMPERRGLRRYLGAALSSLGLRAAQKAMEKDLQDIAIAAARR